jgi:transglutaminase-like putative cysteine protease
VNIPARYCTGYLGDIGVPAMDAPMDFSSWFEAYLAASGTYSMLALIRHASDGCSWLAVEMQRMWRSSPPSGRTR